MSKLALRCQTTHYFVFREKKVAFFACHPVLNA